MSENSEDKTETAELILRPAKREDFLNADGYAKYGVCFWLKSSIDGSWQNSPEIFTQAYLEPDKAREMKTWLSLGMVFIPVPWIELN